MTTKHTKLSLYRADARKALAGKWIFAAEATLLLFALTICIQMTGTYIAILPIILSPIIGYGYCVVMLRVARGGPVSFETLFEGFSDRFWTIFLAYLVITLRTVLWTLLLIIPGIIAAYSYSQTFFILADKKDIGALDAIEESKRLMKGNKWRFFLLTMSFIGWGIVAMLTLGIGYIWLEPYCMITFAKFYESLQDTKPEEVLTEGV